MNFTRLTVLLAGTLLLAGVEAQAHTCKKMNSEFAQGYINADIEDKGLENATFPLTSIASNDFTKGVAAFNSARGAKRTNLGVNLEADICEPVLSMTAGKVLRAGYRFFNDSVAIDIQTKDGRIVRYGMVSETLGEGIVKDAEVKQGQVIGYTNRYMKTDSALLKISIVRAGVNSTSNLDIAKVQDPTVLLLQLQEKKFSDPIDIELGEVDCALCGAEANNGLLFPVKVTLNDFTREPFTFGSSRRGSHSSISTVLETEANAEVMAMEDGVVVNAGFFFQDKLFVDVKGKTSDRIIRYAMIKNITQIGTEVKKGDVVGTATEASDGKSRVSIIISKEGVKRINPKALNDFANSTLLLLGAQ